MFGWFKSKRAEHVDVDADALFDRAIREVHPDRFIDPLEGALWIQPILVNINTLLGRPETERFFAINYDHVVQRVRLYADKGVLPQLMEMSAGDSVLAALLLAATFEGQIPGEGLRPKAEFLISCLNKHSKDTLEPMHKG